MPSWGSCALAAGAVMRTAWSPGPRRPPRPPSGQACRSAPCFQALVKCRHWLLQPCRTAILPAALDFIPKVPQSMFVSAQSMFVCAGAARAWRIAGVLHILHVPARPGDALPELPAPVFASSAVSHACCMLGNVPFLYYSRKVLFHHDSVAARCLCSSCTCACGPAQHGKGAQPLMWVELRGRHAGL